MIENQKSLTVPPLGFGTFALKEQVAEQAVETALEVGYRHIDTAQMYDNERPVGRAIASSGISREDLYVTTKVWRTNLAKDDFLKAADSCLERLGLDYVDLLLIHWPNDAIPIEETLEALQRVRADGKAQSIGVSNFPPSLLKQSLGIVPDLACNQVEYHPLLSQRALLDVVRSNDMFLTAYSPLGQSKILGKWKLRRIARRHGKTTSQVILRWHLQQDRVVPIPRSGNPDHIRANFDIQNFELSDSDMASISSMDSGKRFVNPGWVNWER